MIYLGGSMRNPYIPELAKKLRSLGYEVFDDWQSPGPEADEFWQKYERDRGRTYQEALDGVHARAVFQVDVENMDKAEVFVLVLPAGKSGHMELGHCSAMGKLTIVLFDKEPERFDIMYRFANEWLFSEEELIEVLERRGVEKLNEN